MGRIAPVAEWLLWAFLLNNKTKMANGNVQVAGAIFMMMMMMFNLMVVTIAQRNILLMECLNRFEEEVEALNRARRKRKAPKEWMTLQCVSFCNYFFI